MSKTSQPSTVNLSVSQAQQQIQAAMQPIADAQQISLRSALDRIASSDIIAPMNVPAFDNSAMDGYAFCAQDLALNTQLNLVGSALAGHPYQASLQVGQAIRITTGAKIPERCDTVIPQELAVLIDANTLDMRNIVVRAGEHKRNCGEDLRMGEIAITKGCRLGPAQLGLLASLGIAEVSVQRRLRVAIFSTGDELRSIDQALDGSSVYDSNRVTLHAMLTRFGAEVIDLGVLADNPAELESALLNIAPQVDAIITSGGVASGAADYTKQVMQTLGEITFWAINMRPGRPFAFGKIAGKLKDTYLFGLPGNPVAVMVSFYFFVRPALQKLSGAPISNIPQINAIASQPISKKMGRTEFQRGICKVNPQGQLEVSITEKQGSGILSSMSQANCMVVLNETQADIQAGDTVKLVLFEGLI
ncbi:gephyrin-like molybdotransferase Glp [Solimicrobium silvestre]|uniref:Molybdopterin molybdenumtransferase n=1 Tax=Solimicrobium silvestre TaxID=2099400 RepID=A0A2S9GWX7_9BURK|nr:gephyrin-like molybdotransferase Glp [Solimicrobium silvestre]PRC92227.1 Molybdenum cofactor synthesis domain [Solimicrobium silvestre]